MPGAASDWNAGRQQTSFAEPKRRALQLEAVAQ
jgi:hypothetical protein